MELTGTNRPFGLTLILIPFSYLLISPKKYNAGGNCEKVTPDPIPNSEVKLLRADGTTRETEGESRSSPAITLKASCWSNSRPRLFFRPNFPFRCHRRQRLAQRRRGRERQPGMNHEEREFHEWPKNGFSPKSKLFVLFVVGNSGIG